MRLKLIALFTLIVLVVGGLGYALSRVAVRPFTEEDPKRAPQALDAAIALLEVEGLATERWVAAKAIEPTLAEPFSGGNELARQRAAKEVADKVYEAATKAPELSSFKRSISTVIIVDRQGAVLGQNGSSTSGLAGQNLAEVYPALKKAMDDERPASEVWVSQKRDEQRLASYAPIRNGERKVVGALIVASEIDDGRLTSASDRTSGHALVVGVKGEGGLRVLARSSSADQALVDILAKSPAADAALKTLETGETLEVAGLPSGNVGVARVIEGYGAGNRAALVAVVKPPARNVGVSLLWPAAVAIILGIILVAIAGVMFDAYVRRPITEIEEGLLAIMNGQTNRRLEIEHAELGGVVFRINSLLNQLFGVAEDDTDEDGRPSRPPNAQGFNEAISVDESIAVGGANAAEAQVLFAEPEGAYYTRVFNSYIAAKRSVGDPTDHITQPEFVARLRLSEAELAQKHGKPVRFRVEVKGKEVVLVAVSQA
ncbi:MAG: cache domain-containing protein [Polyangiaceae bacterium]|nr:cache domain-containing protein [Polyangiaceae bacterium]